MSGRSAAFPPEVVSQISMAVYCARLEPPETVEEVIARHGDGGVKLRRNSSAYDLMTRAYLSAIAKRYALVLIEQPPAPIASE